MKHEQSRLVGILSAVVFLLLAATVSAEGNDSFGQSIGARFAKELDCAKQSKDVHRNWCPVARISGSKFSLPAQTTTLLGLTMLVKLDKTLAEQALGTTGLAVLFLGPKEARLTYLRPSNADEKKELTLVLLRVAAILKGVDRSAVVPVSSGLFSYLKGQATKAGYPMKVAPGHAEYEGKLPSVVYRVEDERAGPVYVVIEGGAFGFYVSVFPVATLRAGVP